VVKAAVPGFSPDDIDVSITGNTLTIKGQVSAEEDKEEQNYIFRERHMASFSRMLTLPHEVGAKATAQFENGVLTLTLPKPEEVKPKTIQVKVK
jgi:HSP20 family protein